MNRRGGEGISCPGHSDSGSEMSRRGLLIAAAIGLWLALAFHGSHTQLGHTAGHVDRLSRTATSASPSPSRPAATTATALPRATNAPRPHTAPTLAEGRDSGSGSSGAGGTLTLVAGIFAVIMSALTITFTTQGMRRTR